jgi:hypothetical protein
VRELIRLKLTGQEELVRHKLGNSTASDLIARYSTQLKTADSIDTVRMLEGHAAGTVDAAQAVRGTRCGRTNTTGSRETAERLHAVRRIRYVRQSLLSRLWLERMRQTIICRPALGQRCGSDSRSAG